MLTKVLLTLCPLLSGLAPACSANLPVDMTVFATMMSQSPFQAVVEESVDLKKIHFDEAIRVMSFNVVSDDHKEHPWIDRKENVSNVIRSYHSDLVGLQEPSMAQIEDLRSLLPEYGVFTGACLGKEGQVYEPIFYRESRFKMVDGGFFFLSETPDVLSKGWDGKFIRAVTWVKLIDKKVDRELFFFNTHLDYHGRQARNEGAQLLRKRIDEIAGVLPFVITGDFNLFPGLGGAETYELLTQGSNPFIDAQSVTQSPHQGPTGTWSGFKEPGQPGIKPDFIFVSSQWTVHTHAVLPDTFKGEFPSDHLPVIADIQISY